MANSDISVPSVDHRQEPSPSTTFSIYGPCSRLNHISPLHSRSNPGSPDGTCLQDRSPYYKTRCSIPHKRSPKTDNETSSSASSAKASKPTGVFGKTTDIAVQTSLDQQPHLHHYHGRSSQSMLPTSATNVLLSAISSGTPGSGPSQRPASLHLNFALLSLASMSYSIQPRDLDAEESPSVFHRALVAMNMVVQLATMILAKVPNFTPEYGASDDTDTDTDIHQLTSQFLESANAVADNLSLRLSPPATRSNRRLLSGATKRAILASNTARQAFIAAATHTNPDPVQCNTLRDEWSRLKAAATNSRVDGANNGSSTRQSRRAVSDVEPISYCCCTCHVWKQFP
ncbi:hypothetical protein BASA81_018475 [Batrachochytrium salamandrivorans]|nr:hypothetical protein BASA81_018475 [Batrachochytrium salamandrivorans]